MAALILVAAFSLAPMVSVPAHTETVADWRATIVEASRRFGVPIAWIERVMQAESGGQTTLGGRPIVSRAGAMGLMQLMPGTWTEMRRVYQLGADPYDPHDNIIAGTAYLRAMYDRFGYPGLFAAYNAGPGRYADHLASGRPLPVETRAYLATIIGRGGSGSMVGERAALFFVRRPIPPEATPAFGEVAIAPMASNGSLFIALREPRRADASSGGRGN